MYHQDTVILAQAPIRKDVLAREKPLRRAPA
jgi:hypothetical protein